MVVWTRMPDLCDFTWNQVGSGKYWLVFKVNLEIILRPDRLKGSSVVFHVKSPCTYVEIGISFNFQSTTRWKELLNGFGFNFKGEEIRGPLEDLHRGFFQTMTLYCVSSLGSITSTAMTSLLGSGAPTSTLLSVCYPSLLLWLYYQPLQLLLEYQRQSLWTWFLLFYFDSSSDLCTAVDLIFLSIVPS